MPAHGHNNNNTYHFHQNKSATSVPSSPFSLNCAHLLHPPPPHPSQPPLPHSLPRYLRRPLRRLAPVLLSPLRQRHCADAASHVWRESFVRISDHASRVSSHLAPSSALFETGGGGGRGCRERKGGRGRKRERREKGKGGAGRTERKVCVKNHLVPARLGGCVCVIE
jgi:hypothetical protein